MDRVQKEESMEKNDSDDNDNLSEDESSESEEEPLWTANEERGFLRALSAIKSRDPKIYKNSTNFFDESSKMPSTSAAATVVTTKNKSETRKRKKGDEKMTLRDYERKLVTERDGRLSEDEDDGGGSDEKEGGVEGSNFDKNQRMRDEFKQLFAVDDDEDGGGGEELLRKRVKTEEQKKQEEEDYYDWLKGGESLEMLDEDLLKLKKRWSKRDELDSDELFLRDYLLEKQYENEVDEEEVIPSYDEIVQQEAEEEEVEKFEQKYNFRFEEPDQEFIKQYPRTVKESVRNSKTRRRERRLEKKRMERELLKKIMSEPDPASDDDAADGDGDTFKFKYRSVPANNYGLSTEEILTADDKQLNAWASAKRVCAYRSNEEEQRDISRYQRKAQNVALKEKIFRASSPPPEPVTAKKKNATAKNGTSKKPKAKVKKTKTKVGGVEALSDDRLRAYGVRTKRLKRLRYNKKTKKQNTASTTCQQQ